MEALGTNFEVIPYATGPELVQSLIRGDVNVIVTDYIEAITVVSGNPELLIRGTTFSHEFYGIASELGNNTLIERVNEVLRELKRTGRILEIERMFYSGAQ
jgi:ABC-type amino acid transport substrate-binding protein